MSESRAMTDDELVLNAIRSGHAMWTTGLTPGEVAATIKRLTRNGQVRRKNLGGYEVAHNTGHLGEIW